jgi:hypothetical protein
MNRRQLLLLELNEVNFDYVMRYCEQGALPNLRRLVQQHGVCKTQSERKYEELEPWIQWVTAHTGKTLAEHGVFRLGDIVKHEIPQIWELLEERGLRVGAISPMNAKNRLHSPAFFVPDPWTPTRCSGASLLKHLIQAIAQAVSDNARSRVSLKSLFWLLVGTVVYARAKNYGHYVRFAMTAHSHPWRKAMFLDLLLADIFVDATRKTLPNFATLFLNAAAHIQHHYLFSSAYYRGTNHNPSWYVKPGIDPVGEVYRLYDRIIGQIHSAFPGARKMIATGLHQDPHEEVTYYWRLRDHAGFLNKTNVPFKRLHPLMSRDFVVECATESQALQAEARLRAARAPDGSPVFAIDNRGRDIFAMLTYPREITPDFVLRIDTEAYTDFFDDVAFVAIKNGAHNGIGYFVDTGQPSEKTSEAPFPLRDLMQRILNCFPPETNERPMTTL